MKYSTGRSIKKTDVDVISATTGSDTRVTESVFTFMVSFGVRQF